MSINDENRIELNCSSVASDILELTRFQDGRIFVLIRGEGGEKSVFISVSSQDKLVNFIGYTGKETLRDKFAMAVATGIEANSNYDLSPEDSANASYVTADAMLAQRMKKETK